MKFFSDARPIRKLLGGDGAENGRDLRGKRRVQRKHEMSEDDNPKTQNSGRDQGHAGLEKKIFIKILFLTAEAVLVIAFTLPPPHNGQLSEKRRKNSQLT